MSVGFKIGFYWYEIGTGDFLHSFFSTVAYNLECGKWGSRFPFLMNEFYNGSIKPSHIDSAINELDEITEELKKILYKKVVWDIEDLSKQPPWGDNISPDITDLSNYFVTSSGEDFITILKTALEKGKELNSKVNITSL